MYGLLKIIFGVAAVSVVLVMVGVADLIGWIGAISVHGFVAPEEEARMALGMIFGIALAAIITFVVYTLLKAFYRWEDARNERKFNRRFEYREPTFFQMAYQSFKEKTCVKINFDYEK
jgi:phosphotransferase system  glucose/maltose/N-acetylglucosamine-specific IIC component